MKTAELLKRVTAALADDPKIAEVAECNDDEGDYLEITDSDGDKHDLVLCESEIDEDLDDEDDDDEDDDDED